MNTEIVLYDYSILLIMQCFTYLTIDVLTYCGQMSKNRSHETPETTTRLHIYISTLTGCTKPCELASQLADVV